MTDLKMIRIDWIGLKYTRAIRNWWKKHRIRDIVPLLQERACGGNTKVNYRYSLLPYRYHTH